MHRGGLARRCLGRSTRDPPHNRKARAAPCRQNQSRGLPGLARPSRPSRPAPSPSRPSSGFGSSELGSSSSGAGALGAGALGAHEGPARGRRERGERRGGVGHAQRAARAPGLFRPAGPGRVQADRYPQPRQSARVRHRRPLQLLLKPGKATASLGLGGGGVGPAEVVTGRQRPSADHPHPLEQHVAETGQASASLGVFLRRPSE